MKKIEVFFDYTCPYCYRGVTEFMELLEKMPELTPVWVPCEAHPRPEAAAVHSDVASQAMYSLEAQNGDLAKFHMLVFKAHFKDQMRIDDPEFLSELAAECGGSEEKTLEDLDRGVYAGRIQDNNRRVWMELAFEAVPSYKMGEKTIGSGGGLLVPAEKLEHFMKEN